MPFLGSCPENFQLKQTKSHSPGKIQDNNWNHNLDDLESFKEFYGHTNVPQRYTYKFCLGPWVGKQRGYLTKSNYPERRIESLERVEFDQAPGKNVAFDSAWNRRFQELLYFKSIYGHCNVPCKFDMHKELGYWVKNQRQFYKKGALDIERINLLTELGFEWTRRNSPQKLSWEKRFDELKKYYSYYGTSKIPQRFGPLGKWAQKQRDLYKKNKIHEEKKNLLDSIQFDWNPRKKFSTNFQTIEHLDYNLNNHYFVNYPNFRYNEIPSYFPGL